MIAAIEKPSLTVSRTIATPKDLADMSKEVSLLNGCGLIFKGIHTNDRGQTVARFEDSNPTQTTEVLP